MNLPIELPPPTKLAQAIHLLLCKGNHSTGECQWYIEDQQVERWEMLSHKKWLDKAEGVLLMSLQTEEEIVRLFEQLIPIITQLNFMRQKYGPLKELIDIILKETID